MDISTAAEIVRNDPVARQQAEEQFAEVLTRSTTDLEFRQQLLSEPRVALSRHFGREIPDSVNVVFVENKGHATVVLPDVYDASAELSESELEAVAGGTVDPATAAAALIIGGCIYVLTNL